MARTDAGGLLRNRGCFYSDGARGADRIAACGGLEAVCAPKEYMDRIVAFKVNGSFIPKKVALKPEKPYLRKRILDNLPKEIGHVVHNYNFSQVKSGEISVEKFVSSLTNQELEALTRGEGGMDSSYGVAGNAGAFGGIIPVPKAHLSLHF